MDTQGQMDDHVRQRHLDVAFVCRLCDTGTHHYEPDLPSIKDHLKEDHNKDDLDNEDVMDFVRFPRNLVCIKCNLCGLHSHAQKEEDMELHFNVVHGDSKYSSSHLDFLCRLCMLTGRNDTSEELKDHLFDKHPDEMK